MTGTYFESFMVGGLALLVAAALSVAWLLWRQNDTRKESIALALEGIGHEFRFNMFQTVREIGELSDGTIRLAIDLPRLAQPQLDGLLAHLVATDKRALAAVQATYERIEASKRRVRMELDEGELGQDTLDGLKRATVDGIATLYLWEEHEGRLPAHARSTRSWWVRDWMKAHGFAQDLVPGLALRDSVVDHLRDSGMVLTPQPLALSAYEYYGRQYDRNADPRGVFGKRRTRKEKPVPVPVEGIKDEDEPAEFEPVEAEVVETEVVEAVEAPDVVEVPVDETPAEEPVVEQAAVEAPVEEDVAAAPEAHPEPGVVV